MRKFDFYEFVGILVPGTVLLFGVGLLVPQLTEPIFARDVSIGGFGISLILAYAVGHLLQGVGNLLEKMLWRCLGGMPTDWVRTRKKRLIAEQRIGRLECQLRKTLRDDTFRLDAKLDKRDWYSITREIYATAATAGRCARVDVFNGNYSLFRGLASGFLFLLALAALVNYRAWKTEAGLVVLCAIALYRMYRFGVHYGRELFAQYLQIPQEMSRGGAK